MGGDLLTAEVLLLLVVALLIIPLLGGLAPGGRRCDAFDEDSDESKAPKSAGRERDIVGDMGVGGGAEG